MSWFTNPFTRKKGPVPGSCRARPLLEKLEGRDVPSIMAAEFHGHGVWLYFPQELNGWRQVTAANASQVATDSAGDVVGEFPGQGLWLYSGGAWQEITANNAVSFALAHGTVNPYTPSERVENTFVVAEFPGQGLWRYGRSVSNDGTTVAGWMELTANNAYTEAVNQNGQVAAEFRGQGVWFYYESGWQQVTAADATSLATSMSASGGDWPTLVAEFPGYGVWHLRLQPGSGWSQLSSRDAITVGMNSFDDTVAVFPGWGVGVFYNHGSGWDRRSTTDAALAVLDDADYLYATFPGRGVWFDLGWTGHYEWFSVNGADATSMSAA